MTPKPQAFTPGLTAYRHLQALGVRFLLCSLLMVLPGTFCTPLHALTSTEDFAVGGTPAQAVSAVPSQEAALGVPLDAETLSKLLPATVYFQAKTAPLQLRNAAAVRLSRDTLTWVALVDTSGYATDVQERYQFYLVTEGPLQFGGASVPAGAYGGGFVGDTFLLMDLGGHTLAQGPVVSDAALKRPRPLQLVPETQHSVRLYLGRRWVLLSTQESAKLPAGL